MSELRSSFKILYSTPRFTQTLNIRQRFSFTQTLNSGQGFARLPYVDETKSLKGNGEQFQTAIHVHADGRLSFQSFCTYETVPAGPAATSASLPVVMEVRENAAGKSELTPNLPEPVRFSDSNELWCRTSVSAFVQIIEALLRESVLSPSVADP